MVHSDNNIIKDPKRNGEKPVEVILHGNRKESKRYNERLSSLEERKQKKKLKVVQEDSAYMDQSANQTSSAGLDKDTNELGPKSIFYDPDWNPKGEAPDGFRNVPYNPKTFKRLHNQIEEDLGSLSGKLKYPE